MREGTDFPIEEAERVILAGTPPLFLSGAAALLPTNRKCGNPKCFLARHWLFLLLLLQVSEPAESSLTQPGGSRGEPRGTVGSALSISPLNTPLYTPGMAVCSSHLPLLAAPCRWPLGEGHL